MHQLKPAMLRVEALADPGQRKDRQSQQQDERQHAQPLIDGCRRLEVLEYSPIEYQQQPDMQQRGCECDPADQFMPFQR